MTHPTVGSVKILCGHASRIRKLFHKLYYGIMKAIKPARKRMPIIHFRIYIDRIIRPPYRAELFVPYSLKVSRQTSLCRGGNGQIAAKIEEQLDKSVIFVLR